MGTMKLYELVNHYHIGTELTCAEAMFMACNEYYHLNLSEETRKMFSVMGLGMQTEHSCCGAFTVAVGIIGLMTAKEGQTDAVSYTHLDVYKRQHLGHPAPSQRPGGPGPHEVAWTKPAGLCADGGAGRAAPGDTE